MQSHFLYLDPKRRAELYAVLGSAFPTVPTKVDAARALGFDWDPVTTPFVDVVDDRIVSHVGVLDVPLRLDGRAVRVAGIHAVCTRPEYRRRGCMRRAMEQALRVVDERWELAQLSTHEPAIYEPFGFRVVPTVRFEAPRLAESPTPSPAPIDLQGDRVALLSALSRRAPLSHAYAAMDDGWLFGIDAVLTTGDLRTVWRVPALELFVAGELDGERFTLFDVVANRLPTWRELCPFLPGRGPVGLAFTPDRFPDAGATVAGPADDGAFMVRGPFPLEGQPIAIPRYAQH